MSRWNQNIYHKQDVGSIGERILLAKGIDAGAQSLQNNMLVVSDGCDLVLDELQSGVFGWRLLLKSNRGMISCFLYIWYILFILGDIKMVLYILEDSSNKFTDVFFNTC